MGRRLLLWSFVVALVAGFTLPVFAQERDKPPIIIPLPDDEYQLEAFCSCDWKVTLYWTKNHSRIETWGPFECGKGHPIDEAIEKPHDANDVEVFAELHHPFLSAECLLDKDFHKLTTFRGSCSVEKCFLRFELEKKRSRVKAPDKDHDKDR